MAITQLRPDGVYVQVRPGYWGKTCNAKLRRRPNERCLSPLLLPNGRCVVHAGRGGRKVTVGKWSKHVPANLLERYEEFTSNPEIVSNHEELALVDTRLSQLLDGLKIGESSTKYRQLEHGLLVAESLHGRSQWEALGGQLRDLSSLVQDVSHDNRAWGEVFSLVEGRRRLAETEQKRIVSGQMMLSAQEMIALLASVANVVQTEVTKYIQKGWVADDSLTHNIAVGIERLVSGRVGREAQAALTTDEST